MRNIKNLAEDWTEPLDVQIETLNEAISGIWNAISNGYYKNQETIRLFMEGVETHINELEEIGLNVMFYRERFGKAKMLYTQLNSNFN